MSTDLRPVLHSGDVDRLADDFIAEDRGEGTECLSDWAIRVRRAAARRSG